MGSILGSPDFGKLPHSSERTWSSYTLVYTDWLNLALVSREWTKHVKHLFARDLLGITNYKDPFLHSLLHRCSVEELRLGFSICGP